MAPSAPDAGGASPRRGDGRGDLAATKHIARSPKHTADAPNRARHTKPRKALPSSDADETRVLSLQQ